MATPEYGAHIYDAEAGMYRVGGDSCPDVVSDVLIPMGRAVDGAEQEFVSMPGCIDVPRGVGRTLFSRFDSRGYDVFRRVLESGHFYDQMAAMTALQQSNAQVVGIGSDVNADSRQFRIPYNLLFPAEVENLMSSIYSENNTNYAMHIVRPEARPAQVLQRSVFSVLDGMTPEVIQTLPIIEPGRTQTTRVQALVAGMNLLDGSLNPAFAKRGQISLAGSGEQRVAPEGFDLVEVADPRSGRVFVAYRKSDNSDGPWYAADMLEQAQALIDSGASAPEINAFFGDIELVRFAFKIFAGE